MKKIIFINNLSFGGAERVVSRLFLNKNVYDLVSLWSLDFDDFYATKCKERVVLKKSNIFLTLLNGIKQLYSLSEFHLVQAHLNAPIMLSGIAKILGAKFLLQTVHCFSYSGFYKKKGVKGYIHRLLMNSILKKSSFHIFKSYEMVEDFFNVFGWKPEHYSVIYNPYDIDNIHFMASEVVEPFFLKNKKINIAIVGRLNSSKRPFDILKIASSTSDFAHYHIFGDGNLKGDILAEIKTSSLNNVSLYGMVKNPFKYIKECEVYLSCSESEGFPNALIEAMYCGAIPIHSDCKTGPKEILLCDYSDYHPKINDFTIAERGILFPVSDVNAAIKAIKFVCKNKNELKEHFNENSAHFLSLLHMDYISKKYFKIIGKGCFDE